MAHVTILGLILTLVSGLITFFLVSRTSRFRLPQGLAPLPLSLLLFNLSMAALLVSKYLRTFALPMLSPAATDRMASPLELSSCVLSLGWLYAYFTLAYALHPDTSGRRLPRAARLIALLCGLWLVGAWIAFAVAGVRGPLRLVDIAIGAAVVPVALMASLWLLSGARRVTATGWRTALIRLAAGYAIFSAGLTLAGAAAGALASFSPALPLLLSLAFGLFYNVFTAVWFLLLPKAAGLLPADSAIPSPTPGATFEAISASLGITRREREIADLICRGKTNQEIADLLFISLATVKDHNYTIFQKAGVRNRTELTNLLLRNTPPSGV